MLDVVEFGELAPGIRGDELLELGGGLASKVSAIHQEQHTVEAGKFDEPVVNAQAV